MKKYAFIFVLSFFLFSCGSKEQKLADLVKNPVSANGSQSVESNAAKIVFKKDVKDFGNIQEGQVVSETFTFTNEGKSDLVITHVETTCGCTVPDYPKHPIKKGEKAEIVVKFDSTGKTGQQEKEITIIGNTVPAETKIKIKGNIVSN